MLFLARGSVELVDCNTSRNQVFCVTVDSYGLSVREKGRRRRWIGLTDDHYVVSRAGYLAVHALV